MTALDSDVLSDLLAGNAVAVARLAEVPPNELFVPVVVTEEAMRGRLDAIRKAQQGAETDRLVAAYAKFAETQRRLCRFQTLPYSHAAHALVTTWRGAKVRVGSRDLRIAAIAVAHGAELTTRNRRDFDRVPGLKLSVWN
jgi:tRNA(fMet)-specific endonuclease VapC